MLSTLNQGDRVKKVLVISTSMRSGANSDALADEFVKGAKNVMSLIAGLDSAKWLFLGTFIAAIVGSRAAKLT